VYDARIAAHALFCWPKPTWQAHAHTFRKVLQPTVGVDRARGVPWASKCARDVFPLPARLANVGQRDCGAQANIAPYLSSQ